MNIVDILTQTLPIRVKLNNKFTLDDSFDIGTIIQINNAKIEYTDESGVCYVVYVTCLNQDMQHNNSIACRDWYDKEGLPNLSYFEYNIDEKQANGDYKSQIYVMSNDDCFDIINNKPCTHNVVQDAMRIVSKDVRLPKIMKCGNPNILPKCSNRESDKCVNLGECHLKEEMIQISSDKLNELLRNCWDSSSDYRDEFDRINNGLSNFDKPTYPNFDEWVLIQKNKI